MNPFMISQRKPCNLTFQYSIHQLAYYCTSTAVFAFSTIFLLSKGFSATQAGVIMAAGNWGACLLQPVLGDIADRGTRPLLIPLTFSLVLINIINVFCMQVFPLPKLIFGGLYLICVLSFNSIGSLTNAISIYYSERNYPISLGIGRGLGFFAYAIGSLLFGYIILWIGVDQTMWIGFVLLLILALFTFLFPTLSQEEHTSVMRKSKKEDSISLIQFFMTYRLYSASLIGVIFLGMFHMMIESYFIAIFEPLGGNSSNVGTALAVAAFSAVPVMFFIDKIRARFTSARMLHFAGIAYIVKAVLLLFAPNVISIYLIQLLQTVTYAFLSPAQIFYAAECVDPKDMVKGQTISSSAYSLGCAIGYLVGGCLIDYYGVVSMMIAGVIMTVIGTLILFFTVKVKNISHKKAIP